MTTQQRRKVFVAMSFLCIGIAPECQAGKWDAWFDLLRGGGKSAGKFSNAEQVAKGVINGTPKVGRALHRGFADTEPPNQPETRPPQPVDWEAQENSRRNALILLACLFIGGVAYLFYWNSQLVKRQGR